MYADEGGVASDIVIHDLYIDPTGVMGYTGSPWFGNSSGSNLGHPTAMINVTNMFTGASVPVPNATNKTSQGYYVYSDVSGYSPSLSDLYDVSTNPSSGKVATRSTITVTATITATLSSGETLQSLILNRIPAGALLNDGAHSFAMAAPSSSVNVAGWNLSSLAITPANNTNFTLTATANVQDASGSTISASVNEAVTVSPLAPTATWSPASATGIAGSAISPGALSDTINGLGGDSNSLQSLVVAGLPAGVTLADGAHSFTAASGSTSVNVAGWNLSSLTIMAASAMTFAATATAVVQDAGGNIGSASAAEAVTVNSPSSSYADGSAGASAGTPEVPTLFSGDAVRPPWQVAGVDYHVGVPSGMVLKDPSVSGNLPAGASLNGQTIIVTGNNLTLNGFDFSGGGGYGIYIEPGVSGTQITNNLFVDSSPTSPIPVNIASGASNTYVGYNTINGGGVNGNQTFDETIYNLGTGLTVEYNWIYDAPGRFVSTGAGSLVYKYNLLENGGWLSGVHLNFLQFGGGTVSNPQVDFNTLVQYQTIANGEGFQMYNNTTGSITNGDIGNNTMVSSSTAIQSGAPGPAISYWIHAGSNSQYPSPATGAVHDNYIDTSSAYGAFYPGLSGFTYSNNISLMTGAQL